MDFNVSSKAIGKSSVVLISVEGELDIASAEELVEPTEVAVSTARPSSSISRSARSSTRAGYEWCSRRTTPCPT
jgi:hypothetical protein